MREIQLDIQTPCMQNWEEMQEDKAGRFCNACATSVIDFTAMSDQALLEFFSNKANRNVCGRLHSDQLQTTFRNVPQKGKMIPVFFGVMLSFLLKWGVVNAQKLNREDVHVSPLHGQNRPAIFGNSFRVSAYQYQRAISGKLLDEIGNPIALANVQLRSSHKDVVTNQQGGFVLITDIDQDQISIQAKGYYPKVVHLKADITHYEIVLTKIESPINQNPVIMGKIVIPRSKQ